MAKVYYVTLAAAMQKLKAENPDMRGVKLADVQHLCKPKTETRRPWSYQGSWRKVAPYYGG